MKASGAARFTDQSKLLTSGVTPFGHFYRDQDGALWLPTMNGAMRLFGEQPTMLDASAGLPMRWVRNVFRDREGGLWILGTALARLQGNNRVWNHPLAAGPSGEIVWSMLKDSHGDLLVGTDDGVVRMGASGPVRIPGTEGHRVKGLAFDRSGMLWMVGTTGPTLWLTPGSHKATVAPLGNGGVGPNTVMADSKGQIWISHARLGVLRWDASQRRLIEEVGPETPNVGLGVFRIQQDSMGRMWAATSKGLYLRNQVGAWRLFTEKDGILPFGLHGLAFLPDGSAWIHSREPQGLMRIRIEGEQVTVLDRRRAGQGIRSDMIYAVGVDPQGRTWATTDQGFDCLDTRVHVGRLEGAISEDCDLLALLPEEGRIWVGTSAGLIRYEAGESEPNLPAPVPHILHVMQGDQRLDAPMGSLRDIGAKEANLAFRVAVPSYRHEGQLKIQVRLVGLEEAWRDLDAPLTRYQALPGGHYRFEARAAQPDGPFGPVTSLSFKVMPRWWRTWWAQCLWGLGAVGLTLLIIRIRVASLADSKAALELVVAERTEELRHRNDELTDALGRVKQLSGLLPICASCKKIRDDRGYWNQLEHYISEHSEVGFSHGICPDCVGTMFPGRAARIASLNPDKKV
jgi:ligand-binding sensor domain-containing protein